ncbi:hypothetical protein SDC9_171543 [bioreactor metagenome]|uniref:Uncharacterized protein n=1 Tax=bioreactor metagenome TaxID=1076179 RepID=A0A645GEE7_9ZZZZ
MFGSWNRLSLNTCSSCAGSAAVCPVCSVAAGCCGEQAAKNIDNTSSTDKIENNLFLLTILPPIIFIGISLPITKVIHKKEFFQRLRFHFLAKSCSLCQQILFKNLSLNFNEMQEFTVQTMNLLSLPDFCMMFFLLINKINKYKQQYYWYRLY